MNKYVVRTSLVWFGVLIIALSGLFLYLTPLLSKLACNELAA